MNSLRFSKIIQFTFANLQRIIMFWQLEIKIKFLIKYLYDMITFIVQSIFYFKFSSHVRSQMCFILRIKSFTSIYLSNVHLENELI